MLGQSLQIVERPHPRGDAGIQSSLEEVAKRVGRGRLSPKVRNWAIEQLVRSERQTGRRVTTPRERAEVLLRAVQKRLWVPDPVASEWMAGAHLQACDINTKDEICFLGEDCFPEGTLVLAEGHRLVAIETLKEGDRIWGLDRWSSVKAVAYKGTLSVDAVRMNNGSTLMLTPDHHVYVRDCAEHPMLDEADDAQALPPDRYWRGGSENRSSGCWCDKDKRKEKRVRVSQIRDGMVLTTPERLPFGDYEMNAEVAYVEGLYVADGWCTDNRRFFISGQDGCPKEAQKREVQEICEKRRIPTRWARKYITVKDPAWALHVQLMGKRAPEKRLLSLNLGEGAAGATLRGVMADRGKNHNSEGRTFTTTSRLLAIQTRVLHKMFGVTCGYSYIENHGGLGKNPIYRLSTRATRTDGRHEKHLRVKEVHREVSELPCWDIETDDHRVYLPEHDVTTSQCDGLTTLLGACFLSVGLDTLIVGHSFRKTGEISHVLCGVKVEGKWLRADPSAPELRLGESVAFTRERILEPFGAKTICDSRQCIDGTLGDVELIHYVDQGVFVGVDGFGRRRLRAPLVLLGDVDRDAVAAKSRAAAEKELAAKGSDGGIDRADAEAVGGAVGAAAATVVCAELGPGAAACGAVGGIVGAYVAGALYDAASQFGRAGSYTSGPHMWWEIIRWDVARLHNALALQPSWNLGEAEAALRAVGAKPTPNASYTYYAPYLRRVRADLIGQGAALKARAVADGRQAAPGSASSSSSSSSSSAAPVALAIGGAALLWALL